MSAAVEILEECVGCGDPVPPTATQCGECGERLTPHVAQLPPIEVPERTAVRADVRIGPPGCTCGGGGICTPCVLDEYDGGPS